MVSPRDPNAPVTTNISAGERGFVAPEVRPETVPTPTPEAPAALPRPQSRVAWGAVIAGTLLTISLIIFSSMFAYTVGIPAYAGGRYGVGAGFWSVVTSILAFLSGACLASYLAGNMEERLSMVHGVAVWALTLPLLLFIFNGPVLAVSQAGMVASDAGRLTLFGGGPGVLQTWGSATGAAWGALLSQFFGLLAAAVGGVIGTRAWSGQIRIPYRERIMR